MIITKIRSYKEFREITTYIIVGAGTYIVDFASYWILVHIGVFYAAADTINIPIVLGFNYFMHKFYTFKSEKSNKIELPKYILNSIFLYIYSIGLLIVIVEVFDGTEILAKIIQLASIPLFNYFILKNLVFRK